VNRRTSNITCYGAYVLNPETREIHTVLSRITLLATGGAGMVYGNTTNPRIATGDGIAMVYRAKGLVEKYGIHPVSSYHPLSSRGKSFLPDHGGAQGFGAILKTRDGKEFMHKYDPMGSLARGTLWRGPSTMR